MSGERSGFLRYAAHKSVSSFGRNDDFQDGRGDGNIKNESSGGSRNKSRSSGFAEG
jgi:hypothetical protein